jgi:hypothetical protein
MRSWRSRNRSKLVGLVLAGFVCAVIAPAVVAQDAVSLSDIRDVERTVDELRDRIEQPPRPDIDVADTAIVVTNLGPRARVTCAAMDAQGNTIGRARLRVPKLGLRWLLASDISNDRDFIGSVHCYVSGRVAATAVFLGPGITDLSVQPGLVEGMSRFVVPLAAHY